MSEHVSLLSPHPIRYARQATGDLACGSDHLIMMPPKRVYFRLRQINHCREDLIVFSTQSFFSGVQFPQSFLTSLVKFSRALIRA